ncbi:MAG: diacylglycerol kinase family protein [Pleurocapsa sp.]
MSTQELFAGKLSYYRDAILYRDVKVILTADALIWQVDHIEQYLSLDDVVGVSLKESREASGDRVFYLIINAYPLQKSKFIKQSRRILKEYWFVCLDMVTRAKWQQAINNTLQGQAIDAPPQPRRLQILINPNSGKQKAWQIFELVRPLLTRSNLEFMVTETFSGEDTKHKVREMDLSTVDGLVVVGGDGTIHDAIAGLMSRQDGDRAIQTPIGVIPGGTGNGLCKSLLEISQETYDPLHAAFLIAKGKQKPCDIAVISQNNRKFYSFLSLAWGLIGDVDIESQKLGFLGSLRFDLYSLLLICLLRTYKGRFSFKPAPNWQLPPHIRHTVKQDGEWWILEDEFIFLWAMNTAWAAHDMNVTPYAEIDDGVMDVLIMRQPTSRMELLKALLRCGKGEHLSLPHMEYYQVCSFRLEPLSDRGTLVVDGEAIDYSPIQLDIMPGLATVNCK